MHERASKNKEIVPDGYLPRIVDAQINKYLSLFGAVEIAGTKWCGKTWAARAHGASITYVDRGNNPQVIASDSQIALQGDRPHVIDEWQRVPSVWDTVRHAVDDAGGKKGLWILTGSSTPHKDEVFHSGAGRIGRIRMYPMSLSESGESSAKISLASLFEEKTKGKLEPCQASPSLTDLLEVACRGGWPEALNLSSSEAQIIVHSYLQSIFEQSIPARGKSSDIAERIVSSIARNLCQSTTIKTINADISGKENSQKIAATEKTIASYLNELAALFLYDGIKGWAPPARSPKRVQLKEKRYFADPSIAVAALGLSPESLLNDWQTFGLVFENLCIRDLLVYARALPKASGTPVRYYRDDSGLEVDAIIERTDGSWAAIEIKLSEEKVQEGIDSLLRLKSKLTSNPLAKVREPSFLAVLVGVSEYARQTKEGVYVIPIRTLGA
jgi:predicted AAA+ superfamily ATPase